MYGLKRSELGIFFDEWLMFPRDILCGLVNTTDEYKGIVVVVSVSPFSFYLGVRSPKSSLPVM